MPRGEIAKHLLPSLSQLKSTFGLPPYPLPFLFNLHIPPTFFSFQLRPPKPKPFFLQATAMAATNTLMSCGIATAFPSVLSSSKSKFATAMPLPSFGTNVGHRVSMSADWMPGQPRPPYLDGSAPG